jgi:hypothetical protein
MAYGSQIRKTFNKGHRFPQIFRLLFRRADWEQSVTRVRIFLGVFWLSPIGVTVMLTSA